MWAQCTACRLSASHANVPPPWENAPLLVPCFNRISKYSDCNCRRTLVLPLFSVSQSEPSVRALPAGRASVPGDDCERVQILRSTTTTYPSFSLASLFFGHVQSTDPPQLSHNRRFQRGSTSQGSDRQGSNRAAQEITDATRHLWPNTQVPRAVM